MKNPPLFYHYPGQSKFGTEVTLRDLFAAFVMAGLVAQPKNNSQILSVTVITAYTIADLMLDAREIP